MKPLKLVMQAFGSFRDVTTLDFRDIVPDRLFLIQGKTGSGKTTILDAITFALYGSASGEYERAYRNELADPAVLTKVILTFVTNGKTYTITRLPRQTYIGARGATRERPESVSLVDEEDTVIPLERNNKTIEALIGLTKAQFTQVAILPQGRFMDILNASPTDREALLRSLLKTDVYQRLSARLADKAKALALEATAREDAIHEALSSLSLKTEEDLANASALSQTRVASATANDAQARSAKEQSALALENGKHLAMDYQDLEKKSAELAKLSSRKEEERNKATRLARLKGIQAVMPAYVRLKTSTNRLAELARTNQDHAQALAAFKANYKSAEDLKRRIAENQARQEAITHELAEGTHTIELLAEQDGEAQALSREEERLKKNNVLLTAASAAVSRANDEVVRLSAEEAATGDLSAAQASLLQARSAFEQETQRLSEKSTQEQARDKSRAETQKAGARTVRDQQNLDHAQQDLARAQALYARGAAYRLASSLHEDTPCPVCGSRHHPLLAACPLEVVSDQDLQDKQAIIDSLARTARESAALASAAEARLAEQEKMLASLVVPTEALHQAHADALKTQEQTHEAALSALNALRASLVAARACADEAREESTKALTACTQAEEACAQHRSRLAALKETLSGRPDQATLTIKLASLKAEKARLADDQAREALALASWQRLLGEAGTIASEITQEEKECAEARHEWDEASQAQGVTIDDVSSSGALLDGIGALEKAVNGYEKALEQAEALLKNAKERCAGTTRPDMTALQDACSACEERYLAAEKEKDEAKRVAQDLARASSIIAQAKPGLATLQEKYQQTARLSALVGGTLAGHNKISLERYVLMQQLDVMIAHANPKLERFTDGTYRLQRVTSDASSARGLELEVVSLVTGQSRPISSLSGGESFVAALSLALGLSEAVTAAHGAIAIDALFIDEGFGTLDSQMLENAVTTLATLEDANRMIGIISHVEELREYLPSGIKVTKDAHGASALSVYGPGDSRSS